MVNEQVISRDIFAKSGKEMATCSFSKQFFATGIIFIENDFEMFA